MRFAAIIASFATSIITFVWLVKVPGYDSGAAFAASVAALLASFFLKQSSNSSGQQQSLSNGSIGVQAGRDANFRDINK